MTRSEKLKIAFAALVKVADQHTTRILTQDQAVDLNAALLEAANIAVGPEVQG